MNKVRKNIFFAEYTLILSKTILQSLKMNEYA